jgi:hypothetical protein
MQLTGKEEDVRRLQEDEKILKQLEDAEKRLKASLPPEPKGM